MTELYLPVKAMIRGVHNQPSSVFVVIRAWPELWELDEDMRLCLNSFTSFVEQPPI